jgi:hypothetical protein
LAERTLQNLARFLLHGSAMHGRTDFELPLGGLFQLSDGNARHAINDIIAIIDCTSLRKTLNHEGHEGSQRKTDETISFVSFVVHALPGDHYYPDGSEEIA